MSQKNKQKSQKNKAADPKVAELFEQLEPFFEGILVTMKQFTLTDRARFQNSFTEFLTQSGSNFYESFIEKFRERLKKGFATSMDKMKDVPIDEKFPQIIKDDLDRWEYAKSAILVLFKPLDYAMANGASMTIDMIVKDKWNTDYLQTLNETFTLTKSLSKVFSDSRRSSNKLAVLPVKNILMLYKRENLIARGQVPLIKTFEEEFTKSSSDDYKTFSSEFLVEGIHAFLPKAKQFIEEEDYRITHAMDDDIGEKMRMCLKEDFLQASLETVYSKYDEIIDQDKEIEFQAITKLFEPIGKLEMFADKTKTAFTKYCQQKMENAVDENADFPKDPKLVVGLLFEMLDRLEQMQNVYFLNNAIFKGRLDNAFKDALISNKIVSVTNKSDDYFPKALANFAHLLLKKGSKIETDQEKIKILITKLGKMLNFIGNRDLFEVVYQKNFQERLVMEQVESSDMELYMINELSNICDRQVSYKLQKVYNEHQQSNDMVEKFKAYCIKDGYELPKFDLSIVVFSSNTTQGNQDVTPFAMPKVLEAVYNKFTEFYKTSQTRRLIMNETQSHGVIQFGWMKRNIQLSCRLYQMGILLLFNDQKEITFSQLGEMTKLPADALSYSLSGIVSKGILSCSTDKSFEPQSVFKFNLSFKPKTVKINVMQPDRKYLEKEDKEVNDKINEQLEEGRAMTVQARQVRIMKQRRTMKYIDLINETVDSLRSKFNISSRMARKQIEYLINKDYFKRSDEDREILEYIA